MKSFMFLDVVWNTWILEASLKFRYSDWKKKYYLNLKFICEKIGNNTYMLF